MHNSIQFIQRQKKSLRQPWTFSVTRLSFSAYWRNAMRRVSLSLCPSFSHMWFNSSLCCWLRTTL